MTAVKIDRLLIPAAIVLLLAAPIGARAASADAVNAGAAPAASDNSGTATDSAMAPAAAGPADTGTAVAAPTAPAAAAADADPDAVVAQQLHGLASGKFDTVLGNADVRATVDAFYSGRNYAPIWLTSGSPNARARAAIDYLRHVDADGLNPADYPIPDFAGATDPISQAQAEIRLTASVITYAHHASIGRVHWTRVSGDISYDQKAADPADVLGAMVSAPDVATVLDAYEPHDPAYVALKGKLAEIRAGKDSAGPAIPDGAAPKLGAKDARVPALRERLGLSGDGAIYDKTLADAVKNFQQEHGQKPTGLLSQATLDTLNGRDADRIADIIVANLERWRWMPHDLGSTYVIVNLPDFTLRVIDNGKLDWTTKIVDGKPSTPTPIMSAEMKTITVNPTWNVPPSIVANEYLPLLYRWPQNAFRLKLFGREKKYEDCATVRLEEDAALAGGRYRLVDFSPVKATFSSEESADWPAEKTFSFSATPQGFEIVCDVTLRRSAPGAASMFVGLEAVINFLAPSTPDRYFETNGQRYPLRWGAATPASELRVVDEWQGIGVTLDAPKAQDFWVTPIESVSESEDGFERIYQGSQIMAVWPVELAPGGEWQGSLALKIGHLANNLKA